jgi:hypothetical protein
MKIYYYKIGFNGGFFWLITQTRLTDRSPTKTVERRER